MQAFVDELVSQSTKIWMTVNGKKTKEMLIGSVVQNPQVPRSFTQRYDLDQVSTFKLFGVHISNDLKCTNHVDAVSAKIACSIPTILSETTKTCRSDLLSLSYCTVIRPIAPEYASPVWHSCLIMAQSDVLESLQKRAMNIIFPGDNYTGALTIASQSS